MNGLYFILGFFLILHISIIIGLFLDREKVKKLLRFLVSMVFELVFELGKTLLLAGVIGIYTSYMKIKTLQPQSKLV